MFGRKKLKNQIEKLKREISYLKSQTVGLRFDVDTIDSIVAVPIYVPKEEQINLE